MTISKIYGLSSMKLLSFSNILCHLKTLFVVNYFDVNLKQVVETINYFDVKGWRIEMEDAHSAVIGIPDQKENVSWFAGNTSQF